MKDLTQETVRPQASFQTPTTSNPKIGVLLINVGTPDAPQEKEVARYLQEFLMDPYIIDIPRLIRAILVYGLIVPRRAHQSAEAYQKVWTPEGSPLLVHSKNLRSEVQKHLPQCEVREAMVVGNPSLKSVLRDFKNQGIKIVIALPLFPQFADATFTATQYKLSLGLKALRYSPEIVYIPPFYREEGFIKSFAEVFTNAQNQQFEKTGKKFDHILFSYHGLPERQILKREKKELANPHNKAAPICLTRADCCEKPPESQISCERRCYRAQCFETTRLITKRLQLKTGEYSISFQSRLGRAKWIEPYTEETIVQLAQSGVKNLGVFCPAFVADCLETIEEIGMRGRELFLENGGENYTLIPSLNAETYWAKTVSEWIKYVSQPLNLQSHV